MTAPDLPTAEHKPTFLSRRFAPLISAWVIALVVAGLIYWFEASMPAFHEVVVPLYWIIAAILVFATWRWVRIRGKRDRRNTERRGGDRRSRTTQRSTKSPDS
jgi:membrane protein implicated in regulation of membrane protease activity